VPVRVRLNDGINLVVRAELTEFRKAYEDALKHHTLLEVENGDGKMRVLNPVQILYFEDADEAAGEADRDPAQVPLPDGLEVG
jgi:hypothetical protein